MMYKTAVSTSENGFCVRYGEKEQTTFREVIEKHLVSKMQSVLL
jgi:hypothetical protein